MEIKFKRLDPIAVIPTYAKAGDAGLDFTAISKEYKGDTIVYSSGIAVEIPPGYVGLLFARSSINKTDLYQCNHVGVIDSGYRGELKFIFKHNAHGHTSKYPMEYNVGDRVGQLVIIPYPAITLIEVNELSDSDRGSGGFGSSGN